MGNYVEYPVLNYSLRYLMGDTSQVLIWISTDTCTLKKKKKKKQCQVHCGYHVWVILYNPPMYENLLLWIQVNFSEIVKSHKDT